MKKPTITVPFYGLDREFERYEHEYMALIRQVLSTGRVLQGIEIEKFEEKLAKHCDREFSVATGSCTDALAFALMANDIGTGDEVIVTAYSFFASASPILRVGAIPQFVDIEPQTFMMDLDQVEIAINERTKAIMAVPLFGQTFDMAAMERLAARHGLVLIEDAAQAFGARDAGRPAGGMGQASCVSFDPTKVLASFGSAGALLTNDPAVASRVRMLRYHGRNSLTRHHEQIGYNSQIATDRAAILNFKLTLLDQWQERRDEIALQYRQGLHGINEILLPQIRANSSHSWHKFVVRATDRDRLSAWLRERGVSTMVHYARVLPDEPSLRIYTPTNNSLPVARSMVGQVLSLPIYAELTDEEVCYVIDSIKSFYARGAGDGG